MSRFIFFLFALQSLLRSVFTFAQAPPVQWSRCYGGFDPDKAYSIEQTNDGGYIVAGHAYSTGGDVVGNHGGIDYWILKIDPVGNIIWQKCFGGTNMDLAVMVQKTYDNGFIIAGTTYSNDGDVNGLHGTDGDFWIVKIDSVGNIDWQKCLGGSSYEEASVIRQTADSGYIVGGNAYSSDGDLTFNHDATGQTRDYWIVKLDSEGDIQWQKCYGGSDEEYLHDVRQTSEGNYIVAGIAYSIDGDVTINQAFYSVSWILKLDIAGNILWENGRTALPVVDTGFVVNSILETSSGNYILAGQLAYHIGIHNLYYGLAFLDSIGNFQYAKGYGDGRWSEAKSFDYSSDGGYILCGWNDSSQANHFTWLIVKTDSVGTELWRTSFRSPGMMGDQDVPYAVHETMDGGYIIAGNIYDAFGVSCHSMFGVPDYGVAKIGGTVRYPQEENNKLILNANIDWQTLSLSFYTLQSANLRLSLFDITGRILFQSDIVAIPGTNKKEIPIGDLAKGIYIVTLNNAEGKESVKVVRQ